MAPFASFFLLGAIAAFPQTVSVGALNVPGCVAPKLAPVAKSNTVVANLIVSSAGDAHFTASDAANPNAFFSLRSGQQVSSRVASDQPLPPLVGLSTLSSVTLAEYSSEDSPTPICQASLIFVQFPEAWAAPNAQATGTVITVSSSPPSNEGSASIAYTFGSDAILHGFSGLIGTVGGYHLVLRSQGDPLNINGFPVIAQALSPDGQDAFGSGRDAPQVPVALSDSTCGGGLPSITSPITGSGEVDLKPLTVTLKTVTITCQLSATFALEAKSSIAGGPDLNLSATFTNLESGGELKVGGLTNGTSTFSIGATKFTVQNARYSNETWTLLANVTFANFGSEASAAGDITLAQDGQLKLAPSQASSPIQLRFGNAALQIEEMACNLGRRCEATLGVELPGLSPGETDGALQIAVDPEQPHLQISGQYPVRIGDAAFTFAISSGTISNDVVLLSGTGSLSIDDLSQGMTLKNFSYSSYPAQTSPGRAPSPARLRVHADVQSPSGVNYSVFRLTDLTGSIDYDSGMTTPTSSLALSLKANGKVAAVFDSSSRVQLSGSVTGIHVSYLFGQSAGVTFSVPPEAVSLRGTFFGREIDGGCTNQNKSLFTDTGDGSYEICVGVHLAPGSSNRDVVDDDMRFKTVTAAISKGGEAPRTIKLISAELSYDSSTVTEVKTVTTQKLDDTSNKVTTVSQGSPTNSLPLSVRLGGKLLSITDVDLRYDSDEDGNVQYAMQAPGWAGGCRDEVSGSLSFDVQSIVNSNGNSPVVMTAAVGFGTTPANGPTTEQPCFWFLADGTAGLQIAPDVSGVVYHAEFATYRNAPEQTRAAVHLETNGDLAYKNYTIAFRSISYDDPGTPKAIIKSQIRVDTPSTIVKNVPAIATFLGAVAARLLVK